MNPNNLVNHYEKLLKFATSNPVLHSPLRVEIELNLVKKAVETFGEINELADCTVSYCDIDSDKIWPAKRNIGIVDGITTAINLADKRRSDLLVVYLTVGEKTIEFDQSWNDVYETTKSNAINRITQ